jgi:cell surface protein SprA
MQMMFRSVLEISHPNWSIKYSGLMRYGIFKKRFSLQSNYRASYTINVDLILNSIKTQMEWMRAVTFFNKTIMSNINGGQFNPLMRMDFELKSSLKVLAEIKKDRALSMSFDNNLLTK